MISCSNFFFLPWYCLCTSTYGFWFHPSGKQPLCTDYKQQQITLLFNICFAMGKRLVTKCKTWNNVNDVYKQSLSIHRSVTFNKCLKLAYSILNWYWLLYICPCNLTDIKYLLILFQDRNLGNRNKFPSQSLSSFIYCK